ncbi:MAG: response regulator [bacterium]
MARKILIVDDDVDFTQLLSARLRANNYDVVTAGDAYDAVAKAQQQRPSLIILDIRLPAGGGFRVYETLKASVLTSRIAVLFVTGFDQVVSGQEKKVRDALQTLNQPFLIKPFAAEELLEKVKQALEQLPSSPDPKERALVKEIINSVSPAPPPAPMKKGLVKEIIDRVSDSWALRKDRS